MTTTVHTPGYIDYDAVERLTQLLIMAAQRKRTLFYWQAVAACQGGDLDQVIRGNIQPDKDAPPTNDTLITVINHIAQVCKSKAWPPLTILITKDGKTVSTGYWTHSPLGDLSGCAEDFKRRIELHWRQECFAFFDALSALNSDLSARVGNVYKAIRASTEQYPQLLEAFTAVTTPVIDGVTCPMSLSSIDALVRQRLVFDEKVTKVLSYDDTVFVGKVPPEPTQVMVLLPVGETRIDFIRRAFKKELTAGQVVSPVNFEILGVLSETQENLEFNCIQAVQTSPTQNFSGRVVVEDLDPNLSAPRCADLAVGVDLARGLYSATCTDIRVTNIMARVTAQID